jgi:hypothetical protein
MLMDFLAFVATSSRTEIRPPSIAITAGPFKAESSQSLWHLHFVLPPLVLRTSV